MPSTVASVHELATELLGKCSAALGTTVGGVPPVVSLSPGLPAIDRQCDQLYVYETIPIVEAASVSTVKFAWRTFIGLAAAVYRCVPVASEVNGRMAVPTVLQLSAASEKVMEDMWALWNGVTSEILAGDLFQDWPCRDIRFVSMDPLDPQGGFAGWTLQLQVELDGYEVTL